MERDMVTGRTGGEQGYTKVKDGYGDEDRIERAGGNGEERELSGITMRAIESRTGSRVNDSRLELVHSK